MLDVMEKPIMQAPTFEPVFNSDKVYDILNGLLLDVDFAENNGNVVIDHSGRHNNGVINEAKRVSDLNLKGSLTFDGVNDMCIVPFSSEFMTVPFSIYREFEIDQLASSKGEPLMLFDLKHSAAPWHGYYLSIDSSNDKLLFIVVDADENFHGMHSDVTIEANKKYKIAVTVDASYTMRMMVNGVIQSGTDNCISLYPANLEIHLATDWSGWARFKGKQFDCKFWSGYSLTSSDVDDLMAGKAVAVEYLEAWWPYKDGSGLLLTDATGNGHNGTITEALWKAPSRNFYGGRSLKFDGQNDYVDFGELQDFKDITGSFSICALYRRYVKDTVDADGIVGNWHWTGDAQLRRGAVLRFYINQDQVALITELSNGSSIQEIQVSASAPLLNNWYFVIGTYEKTTRQCRIYLDGELAGINTSGAGYDTPMLDSPSNFLIGHNPVNNGYFNGEIAWSRIYERLLTADEARNLYHFIRYKYMRKF